MNATELTTLSMSELKAFCTSHAIEVVGDKRSKATYINAIETFQSEQTVIEMPAMPDPFEAAIDLPLTEAAVMAERSTNTPFTTDLPAIPTTQHHGASNAKRATSAVVVLIPLIMLSLAVIAIRIGIGALIPLIGSLLRFMGSIWQSSITGNAIGTESIPIDPLFLDSKWALLE